MRFLNTFSTRSSNTTSTWRLRALWILLAIAGATSGGWRAALARPAGSPIAPAGRDIDPVDAVPQAVYAAHSTANVCELFVSIIEAPSRIDTTATGYPPAAVRIRYGYRSPDGSSPDGACLLVSGETSPLRVFVGRTNHSASFQSQPVEGSSVPQWEATGSIQFSVAGTYTLRAEVDGEDALGYRTVSDSRSIVVSNQLPYDLTIAPQSVPSFAEPGSQHTVTFRVTNTGYNSATIELTCQTLTSGGSCFNVNPSTVPLASGASQDVSAQVLLPRSVYEASYEMTGLIQPPTNVGYTPQKSARATIATRPAAVTSIAYTGGDRIERSLCPIVGAAPGSAVQCGDLVYAHDFPAYRSRNKPRGLTLLYNSATADARPVVVIDQATNQGEEATRFAVDIWRITPNGDQQIAAMHFDNAGALSDAHRIRRMVVPIAADALGLMTGAYPIRVQVTRFWSSGSEASVPVTGTLLVVNRKRSAWGAGWWPAGIERLHPNQANGEHVLLEDADGSVTLFRWDGTRFVAPLGEYSTLARGGPGFIRTLPGKRVEIHYDAAGLMVQVRQLEAQPVTASYHWDRYAPASAPRLQQIVDAAGIVTSFGYGDGQVSTITLPHASAVTLQQVATGTSGVFLLEGIVDPDQHVTTFAYDAATARMRTSDARATSAFTYEYDAVGRVARVLTPLSGSDPLTTRYYTSWQSWGAPVPGRSGSSASDLAPAALRDSVAFQTWQQVPSRTASAGESRAIFFPHVTGAPTLVHMKGGNTTHFERDSAGQATLVRTRSGAYVEQQWDARGRLAETRQKVVGGWLTPDAVRWDTTRYEYNDPRWDGPTRIVPPRTAEAVTIGYDDYGRRHTVTDSRGKTTTLWYAADGMLDSVRSPLDHPVVYDYDATTRNLRTVTQGTSTDRRTTTYTYAPNGIELQSTSDGTSTTVVELDAVKRVRRTQTGVQFMVYEYDDAARTVRQTDPANRTTTWTYDELGRPLTECRVSGCLRTSYHGPVPASSARDGGGSHTFGYDMDGRLVERVSDWQGLTDKVVTGYDEFGNVTGVINHTYAPQIDSTPYAKTMWRTPSKIERQFDAYGRLICEQQSLQELRDTTRFHGVSGWYVYDRMGRRVRNIYGGAIGCGQTQHYPTEEIVGAEPYSPATWGQTAPPRMPSHGLLDPNDAVTYRYDVAGRLDSLTHRPFARNNPAGGTWAWTYDDENRPKTLRSPIGDAQWSWRNYNAFGDLIEYGATGGWTAFTFGNHDAAGRATLKTGGGSSFVYEYDDSRRLKREHDQLSSVPPEVLEYDALGNIKRRGRNKYDYAGEGLPSNAWDLGRLLQMTDTVMQQVTHYQYDRVGNETKSGSPEFMTGGGYPARTGDREQQYTARSQLRWSRTRVNHHNNLDQRCTKQAHAVLDIEERLYEYDGLGRRVLEVSTHGCAPDYGVSRYFWLDDQVVVKTVNFLVDVAPVASYPDTTFTQSADVEHPVEHTASGVPALLGQWFVYGPGIDNVLGVRNGEYGVPASGKQLIRAQTHLYMTQDERGSVVRSVCRHFTTGAECGGPSNGGYTAFGVAKDPAAAMTSMPGYNGHQATAGLVYMRNRWYDPNSGRFTQEDPIGFAGGSNLYAYAGNDPVNYADPFGLSPDSTKAKCPDGQRCVETGPGEAQPVTNTKLGTLPPGYTQPIDAANGVHARVMARGATIYTGTNAQGNRYVSMTGAVHVTTPGVAPNIVVDRAAYVPQTGQLFATGEVRLPGPFRFEYNGTLGSGGGGRVEITFAGIPIVGYAGGSYAAGASACPSIACGK